MDYRLYLFDFDYTLANSERGILLCFKKTLENNGYAGISDAAVKKTIGLTLAEAFAELTGLTDESALLRLTEEYVGYGDALMNKNTAFFDGAPQLLRALKAAGRLTGIVSNKYGYRITEFLNGSGSAEDVDIVIGFEGVEKHKPDPEGVLKAAKTLGIPLRDTVYIGDSVVDALTAQSAGVDFILTTTGVTTAEDIKDLPHLKIVSSLNDII
jgi:phosphoglycolate phosphatase